MPAQLVIRSQRRVWDCVRSTSDLARPMAGAGWLELMSTDGGHTARPNGVLLGHGVDSRVPDG
jgi:hypothetical protein